MAIKELFGKKLEVINVGLELFGGDLTAQEVPVRQVRFTPPAGGDPRVPDALDYLARPEIAAKIEAANRQAVERILQSKPTNTG